MNQTMKHLQRVAHVLVALSLAWAPGCATMSKRPTELLPTRATYQTGPFVIHSHKKLGAKDPMVKELESLTKQVAAKIGGPVPGPEKTVDVYILADEGSFQHFLHYYHPELPARRAYFIATEKSRTVYTYQGDHLMEDLRHESTHALVNLTHPGLPLWLDEGMAEVFEHPDLDKTPDPHRDRFLADIKSGVTPDLKRLENVEDVRKLTPKDYREAWAWVEWGLVGPQPAKKAFRAYLDDVMRLGESEAVLALKPLSTRWAEVSPEMQSPQAAMLAWVNQPTGAEVATTRSGPVDPNIKQTRLQNSETEKPGAGTKRSTLSGRQPQRGFVGRVIQRIFGGG